jgi:dinuclear metal center YbgI/SA1388 family protein
MRLDDLIAALDRIAPLTLAADWDNVGLLVEPSPRLPDVEKILFTIDLTEPVLAEAGFLGAGLVVAYHPPIFGGLKRLTRATPGERVVLDAVRAGIAVYSPHTALDAAADGLSDWLAAAVGPGARRPIEPGPAPGTGMGRALDLDAPASLADVVARVKAHLGLAHVRVAAPRDERPIRTAAVCAGAGGSVFERVRDVDLLLTGEMRHHDVLARAARGTAVVLCDHTNTERGFLPHLAARVHAATGVATHVARADRDPLVVT